MPSQLESRKETLAHLRAQGFGEDNPVVKGLREQIAAEEKQPAKENPMDNFSVEFRRSRVK